MGPGGGGELAFRVPITPVAQVFLPDPNQARRPAARLVVRGDQEAEVVDSLRWQLPASVGHGVLAVDFDARDPIVSRVAVTEAELPVQVDLDEGAHVGLLGFVQLIVLPPAGVLAVVKLVKRVPEHRRHLVACRVKPVQFRLHRVQLSIRIVVRNKEQRLVDHQESLLVLGGETAFRHGLGRLGLVCPAGYRPMVCPESRCPSRKASSLPRCWEKAAHDWHTVSCTGAGHTRRPPLRSASTWMPPPLVVRLLTGCSGAYWLTSTSQQSRTAAELSGTSSAVGLLVTRRRRARAEQSPPGAGAGTRSLRPVRQDAAEAQRAP